MCLLYFLHWLVIIDIPIFPCSLLDSLGRSYTWDLQLFLVYGDSYSKDEWEGKALYVPLPENFLKVRDLGWLLLLLFLTTASQYEIETEIEGWQLTGDRPERIGMEIQIAYCL